MLRILVWRLAYHFFCFLKAIGIQGRSQFYFAYGGNLDPQVLRRRKIHPLRHMDYLLEGFRLTFDHEIPYKGAAMASITPSTGERVPGRIYEIRWIDSCRLDCMEAHTVFRRYAKRWMDVPGLGFCFYYRTNRSKSDLLPLKDYVRKILEGYRLLSVVDSKALENLERIPALDQRVPKDPPDFLIRNYEALGRSLRPLLVWYDRKCVRLFAAMIFKPSWFERWCRLPEAPYQDR